MFALAGLASTLSSEPSATAATGTELATTITTSMPGITATTNTTTTAAENAYVVMTAPPTYEAMADVRHPGGTWMTPATAAAMTTSTDA